MSPKMACKMCSSTPRRSSFSKINSLPKTFTILLEEMGGRKFSKSDLDGMVVCNKCIDFLKNMENSIGPKSNKITGAGKERVFKLMDKKRIPTGEAIEIVLAEQRAKEMLVAAGLKKLDKDGNTIPVAGGAGGGGGSGSASKALPSLLDMGTTVQPVRRMSGAQRKKVGILVAGGMDPAAARELVYAASLANAGNLTVNPIEIAKSLQVQAQGQAIVQDEQRSSRRRRNRRRGDRPPTDQVPNGQGNGAPVAPVKSNANQQKTGSNPKGPVAATVAKKLIDSPGILIPQSMRQNSSSAGTRGGAATNSDRRGGAATTSDRRAAVGSNSDRRGRGESDSRWRVGSDIRGGANSNSDRRGREEYNSDRRDRGAPSRRNERPAPYNINNNNNRRQPNQSPWENQSNQQDNSIQNFNQQLQSLQQQSPMQPSHNTSIDIGIVPIKYPNDMLDDLKLDALKEAITNEILKIAPGGPLIRFLGTSSQNGWLKVTCADQMSYNWLAQLVARWERAGIRLVEGKNMPESATLSFYLDGDFRSPDEIINIIEKQNDSLNASAWRLVNRERDGNGQRITIGVNEQCFQALRRRDFYVFLGLGVVELKPCNNNNQNNMSSSFNQNNSSSSHNNNYNNGNNDMLNGNGNSGGRNRSADFGHGYNGNNNQNHNNMGQRGGYQQRVW